MSRAEPLGGITIEPLALRQFIAVGLRRARQVPQKGRASTAPMATAQVPNRERDGELEPLAGRLIDDGRTGTLSSMDAQRTSVVIGIGGGTGSGKTTFARALVDALPTDSASLIDHDAYYRDLSARPPEERSRVNFDHPDALESELLAHHLVELRDGRAIQKPVYDFRTHTRSAATECIEPTAVVVVEGILVLAVAVLREHFDLALFVDAPADLRLLRRIRRDILERGRDIEGIGRQYESSVRPMHETHVEPSRVHADLVVSGLGDFSSALRTTADALRHRLRLV